MKSKNETAALEAALKKCRGLKDRLAKHVAGAAVAACELEALQGRIDIADEAEVGQAARLLAVGSLAQGRAGVLTADLEGAQKALVTSAAMFTREAFAPRYADLEARALKKVEEQIASAYSDTDSLRGAAYNSTALRDLAQFDGHRSLNDYSEDEAITTAEKLLAAWAGLTQFEQAYLS